MLSRSLLATAEYANNRTKYPKSVIMLTKLGVSVHEYLTGERWTKPPPGVREANKRAGLPYWGADKLERVVSSKDEGKNGVKGVRCKIARQDGRLLSGPGVASSSRRQNTTGGWNGVARGDWGLDGEMASNHPSSTLHTIA